MFPNANARYFYELKISLMKIPLSLCISSLANSSTRFARELNNKIYSMHRKIDELKAVIYLNFLLSIQRTN